MSLPINQIINDVKVISSVGYTNKEIINNILKLHIKDTKFHLDTCFSLGKFYKGLEEPIIKSDINPQRTDVLKMDSTNLFSLTDGTISSIMFDPPFMFGTHGQTKNNLMNKRFSMFDSFNELEYMYKNSLKNFYRILKRKGVLVFKCQDYTDTKTTMTHCFVHNWAIESGFYPKDLFILISKSRIYNSQLNQRHARKFHSYFWVFDKK